MVRQPVRHWRNRKQSGCWRERERERETVCVHWCVCYHPALNLDRKLSFLCSDQTRLKSGLLSYASCSVISRSSFFMIHIYRFTKCVCFYNQAISLTSSVTPVAWLLFWMSCISLFIPVVVPVVDVFLVPYFELSTSWQVHKEFSENKVTACLTWYSIMGLQM